MRYFDEEQESEEKRLQLIKKRRRMRRGSSFASNNTISSLTAVVNGANIDVTFTTVENLLTSDSGNPGVVGIFWSIGEGVAATNWQDVAADESYNHVFSIPLATIGAVAGDVINIDPGYSLTSPAGTIVSGADSGAYITPTVYTVVVSDTSPTEGVEISMDWDYIIGPPAQVITYRWTASVDGTVGTAITYTPTAGVVGETLVARATSTRGALTAFDDSPATDPVASASDPDAQAIIDEADVLGTALNAAAQQAIQDFVTGMKALSIGGSNAWAECGEIACFLYSSASSSTDGSARMNWKAPTGTKYAIVSTVTFSQNAGSLGQYISGGGLLQGAVNIGSVPGYTQNSCHFSAFCTTAGAATNGNVGFTNDSATRFSAYRAADSNSALFMQGSSPLLVAASPANATGFWLCARTGANDVALYRDGVSQGSSGANASASVPANRFEMLEGGGAGDEENRWAYFSVGSGGLASVAASYSALVNALIDDLQAAT